ncbi:MAG: serine/threonine-protein kinase, partial [Actinomycetota bacterium]
MGAESRIGTDFAGYRIESVLGRGGMGVVYLAEDTRLGRKVALKLLSPDLGADERFRDRFIRESRMAAGLEHPNIVPVHEAGDHDGQLYIAMRYIEGSDLGAVVERDGPLAAERVAPIVEQVAEALDTAHDRGLIHRDVKPANILIEPGRRDRAYLTDFGVTKRAGSRSGLTQTGQFMGTVDYMAPEQIEGKELDGRADQYSLGCVVYECLTGEPPFVKDSEVATIYAHLRDAPPRVTAKRAEVPSAVDGVLARAMAKTPQARYANAGEFAVTLRAVVDRGIAETRVARRPWRAVAVVGSVVLLAAIATVVALVRTSPPGTPA